MIQDVATRRHDHPGKLRAVTGKARVLVIDADPDQADWWHETLQSEGYEPLICDAEQLPNLGTVQLAFIAISLPSMNGFRRAAGLRRLPGGKDLPLVAMLNKQQIDAINHAYNCGIDDHVVLHTTDAAILQQIFMRWLEKPRSHIQFNAAN